MSQCSRARSWPLPLVAGAIAVSLTGSACSDGPTEPAVNSGTISFSYSGAETGSFTAAGPATLSGPVREGAGAFIHPESGTMVLVGVRPRPASRADWIQFFLPTVAQPTTVIIDPGANELCYFPNCPQAVIAFDVGRDSPTLSESEAPDNLYFMTEGTVMVTSVSATRMTGTFHGKASGLALIGEGRQILVSNGTFDVPVSALRDR